MTHPPRKSTLSAALFGAALAVSGLSAAPALADEMLEVRDFVLTHGVYQREPTDNVQSYGADDGKAVAFARIRNSGAPTTVNFIWHYNNEQHGSVSMRVGTSGSWRTWSSANLRPGNWRVELFDATGELLTSKSFSVGMAGGAMPGETAPATGSGADDGVGGGDDAGSDDNAGSGNNPGGANPGNINPGSMF